MEHLYGEPLMMVGIAIMVAAALLGVAAIVVLCASRKKLREQLEEEYGKKQI